MRTYTTKTLVHMKHTKKAALMLAVIPVVGALAFADVTPAEAHKSEGSDNKNRQGLMSWAKIHDRNNDLGKDLSKGLSKMLKDHGKHRGWVHKNPEAIEWVRDVHQAIKDNDYNEFEDLTDDTVLGEKTTQAIFGKLVDASNEIDDKDFESARDIMQDLKDDGYHFKRLFHESLKELFPKK